MGDESLCPMCGERLPIQGLAFFMVNVVVDKHCKASPGCKLRVDFFPEEKRVEIKASEDEGQSRD